MVCSHPKETKPKRERERILFLDVKLPKIWINHMHEKWRCLPVIFEIFDYWNVHALQRTHSRLVETKQNKCRHNRTKAVCEKSINPVNLTATFLNTLYEKYWNILVSQQKSYLFIVSNEIRCWACVYSCCVWTEIDNIVAIKRKTHKMDSLPTDTQLLIAIAINKNPESQCFSRSI